MVPYHDQSAMRSVLWVTELPTAKTVTLHKRDPLQLFNIWHIYHRVKRFVVPCPTDKVLRNEPSFSTADYFIYLKIC